MRKVFDIYLRTAVLFPSIYYEEDESFDKLRYLSPPYSFTLIIYVYFYKSHTHKICDQSKFINYKLQGNLSKCEIILLYSSDRYYLS